MAPNEGESIAVLEHMIGELAALRELMREAGWDDMLQTISAALGKAEQRKSVLERSR
ncbi:hypothetical protein M8997_001825 [Phyllobacterium sp. 21LDTY02-6]|jgi:hypothetical protein|uniref:hypothetical protein n=1 Tax=unclassified Phyllobacterium TaxID=2638441 RepID=UPI00201FFE51|nr:MULTISPECIES: hypothetical protein [unclassified Phyllobacterium]MCO4315908.1 hypothetical protein [Phyllobacterium sp. 21LDTY02-6]MCX8279669.1 hypothetical protein [Phyllobacterium sp. 0TCS1.6C]MCX8292140.1 hypothetical protein [Phyllobacterium sp. 0TCS1.6A]